MAWWFACQVLLALMYACAARTTTCGALSQLAQLSSGRRWDGIACSDSGTLHACVEGRSAEHACADDGPGFTCQSFQGAFFCGLASQCLPADVPRQNQAVNPVSCEGNTIIFCNAGRIERVSCTDGCEEKWCVPSLFRTNSPD